MAHHKSAKKRIRQTEKRNLRNRMVRSSLRTSLKQFKSLLTDATLDQATVAYPDIQSDIDRAVSKGVLKAGTANRYKSRLILNVQKRQAAKTEPPAKVA